MKFNIFVDNKIDLNRLPSARTCFNQLIIPEYKNSELLKKKLLIAISDGCSGFGTA